MLIPNITILQALTDLSQSGNKNWDIFCNWLAESYSTQVTMLINIDEERQSAIFTGRCRELKELYHFIENSKLILEEQKKGDREVMVPMTAEEAIEVID